MYTDVFWDFSENTDEPDGGSTSVVIGRNPRVIGSGARLVISYRRNATVLDCAENLALQEDNLCQGLSENTIRQILPDIATKPGWKATVKFKTLCDGSFHLDSQLKPETSSEELLEPIAYPSVLFSDLLCIDLLAAGVYLVDAPPHGRMVLKIPRDSDYETEPAFARTVKFLIELPDVEFLIRPKYIVLDTANVLRGFLMDYHPASSLGHVLLQSHENYENDPKRCLSVEQDSALVGDTAHIPWAVKLSWTTDIAAGVAWLHSQNIFWGDLKLDNIVLCGDGHCRLIDYVPGSHTEGWCPPECAIPHEAHAAAVTAAHDAYALGLILWCLAEELPTREEGARPAPGWVSETCYEWYGQLVDLCLRDDPQDRPSAKHVYETLVDHNT